LSEYKNFDYYVGLKNIKTWSNTILHFDIKKIRTIIKKNKELNQKSFDWDKRYGYAIIFFDTYLENKTDFVVEEIEIDDNRLFNTLIKYTNYKKLLIKYDKDFNDNEIKAHCVSNNIVFGYC
jgi:hypothetical protein